MSRPIFPYSPIEGPPFPKLSILLILVMSIPSNVGQANTERAVACFTSNHQAPNMRYARSV